MAPRLSKLKTFHHGPVHRDITNCSPGCFTVILTFSTSKYGGLEILEQTQNVQPNLFSPQFPGSNTYRALNKFPVRRFASVSRRFVFFDSRLLHRSLGHYEETELFKLSFLFTVNDGLMPSYNID